MKLQETIRRVLMEESKGNFMKIKSIKVINGKNKWSESKDKLIHMVLDLGVYESRPSNKIEGFYERIKEHLPSLKSHRCSVGKIGGFLSRVKEGTWMGHIIEHVALELQTLAGMDTGWGRTRGVKGQEGVYNVVFNYEDEDKGKLAAREAFNVVNDIIENRDPHIDKIVKKLKPKKKIQETIRKVLRETKEMKEGVNLNEDEDRLNQILDKINTKGMNSLNNREKTFLYSLNKTDTPQETKTYDYKITVISNKNYSFEMIKKFIERLLKNNGIESEVSYNFMGLGMGFSYEIRLNNYFLYKNEIRDFLTKNGFKIIEEGPINNNTKISQDVVNKIQRHTKNYDVLISSNHGHKITSSQEIERIGKILNRNNIRNYSMSGDNGSIELTLTSATKEEKDKIYIILSNSGYDVTQNQKGKDLKETIRRHTIL